MKTRVLHLALRADGPAPWSPWITACGRKEWEEDLATDETKVSCKACLRTEAGRDAVAEQMVLAMGLSPTPAATCATVPCDQEKGPTPLETGLLINLPPQLLVDIQARAALGRDKYGMQLRAPWPQGLNEALPELLDAVAYLLSSGHPDSTSLVRQLVPIIGQLHRLLRGEPAWPASPEAL